MIVVAVSLLPVLGVLLYAMDRIEDRLSARPSKPRHARGRHLHLVRGGAGADRTEHGPAERPARRLDVA